MAVELDVPYKQGYLWIPPNGQVKKVSCHFLLSKLLLINI